MAKAVELSDDIMTAPPVPKAAQVSPKPSKAKEREVEAKREPLQVRWPAADVKAAKMAAIERDFPTVSDFMLACFHAYMQSKKV
jgi:hypothetical protein